VMRKQVAAAATPAIRRRKFFMREDSKGGDRSQVSVWMQAERRGMVPVGQGNPRAD
jgi:hypothetical protein